MTPLLTITAYGVPGPQGSKKARAIYKGRGANRQFTGKVSVQESSRKVGPWREAVKKAAELAAGPGWVTLDAPLLVEFCFTFDRGRTVKRRHHTVYPDLSKLIRSTEDALTGAGIWADDARVVAYHKPRKLYVGAADPDALPESGVVIRIWTVQDRIDEVEA
ncbi:RusA family crossover junction endodeoxyribonuclease [Streptosporangium saharense]|uniref:Holliday junction resolvase RusA-like endonuclease n=1 Tax=Streptosporangium saharense TaxID=1706840 RepID=A0A7W7QK73_9ACTN|nr:RusA family crossover junction endodeoxyribonuclease [Streptosporangium saharense]MBB4915069.1 Holliday junction resolvase RusA-like endonuclease [Streptosporangium saharense]